jgi:hypothetical protein
MYRDYSKNALVVMVQREEDVYRYLKGEGLEQGFGVISIEISTKPSFGTPSWWKRTWCPL